MEFNRKMKKGEDYVEPNADYDSEEEDQFLAEIDEEQEDKFKEENTDLKELAECMEKEFEGI